MSPTMITGDSPQRSPRSPTSLSITLLGDLMLGRLIDQLLPTHVHEEDEARLVSRFRSSHSHLRDYGYASPWGNWLPIFQQSDLVCGNLETAVTTHDVKWPDKVFNYRTHPENVNCLTEAGISFVSLANNHTLDFGRQGLLDTVRALKDANINFAGASESQVEAERPAKVTLQSNGKNYAVQVYSFSDHPTDWKDTELFNFLDYTVAFKQKLQRILKTSEPALKIVAVHWGPNYRWSPDREIRDMAHWLVESCGVDIVWGHSSHHVQGVEIFCGKLIIYGCGDFVDDYAVSHEFRNDLSAAWRLGLEETDEGLCVSRLEVRPNRIEHFRASALEPHDKDHRWVRETFTDLCAELGTTVNTELGSDGQILVDVLQHARPLD